MTPDLLSRLLIDMRPAFVASTLKKILRVRRKVVETKQGKFFIDPISKFGYALAAQGEYEPEMTSTLSHFLGEGDVFLDVGANEGYFSIIASRLTGNSGRVVAVEPQSRLQSVLAQNIALNPGAERVEIVQAAISDVEGTADMFLTPDVNTGSSGLAQTTRYRNPVEKVPRTTLASLLAAKNLDRVDLLKMDIEGFEYEAVLGSPEVFRSHRVRNFALELHPSLMKQRGKNGDDIVGLLSECGYRQSDASGNLVFLV